MAEPRGLGINRDSASMKARPYIMIPRDILLSETWLMTCKNDRILWFVLMLTAGDDGIVRTGITELVTKSGFSESEIAESISRFKESTCRYGRMVASDEGLAIPWHDEMRKKRDAVEFFENNLQGVTSGMDYRSRNYWLGKIGFKTYQDYLKSQMWRFIRDSTDMRLCSCCDKPATQIHHSRYHKHDLTGKTRRNLHPICGACHQAIEYNPDGTKATLVQANEAMRKLVIKSI